MIVKHIWYKYRLILDGCCHYQLLWLSKATFLPLLDCADSFLYLFFLVAFWGVGDEKHHFTTNSAVIHDLDFGEIKLHLAKGEKEVLQHLHKVEYVLNICA